MDWRITPINVRDGPKCLGQNCDRQERKCYWAEDIGGAGRGGVASLRAQSSY